MTSLNSDLQPCGTYPVLYPVFHTALAHSNLFDVVFVIENIGDYHAARLVDLAGRLSDKGSRLLVVELRSHSRFYRHRQPRNMELRQHLEIVSVEGSRIQRVSSLFKIIRDSGARCVVQIGYSEGHAIISLAIARLLGKKVVFLSDSKVDDAPRVSWKEFAKRIVLPRFDGAFVAGERHRQYFISLGMAAGSIGIGYDVVDNQFIARRAKQYRGKETLIRRLRLIPERYVLVVARLVERKRVETAIKCFMKANLEDDKIDLVIIGDGPLAGEIDRFIAIHGLSGRVHRISEVPSTSMPLYYAFAEALILASEYDQWGLCVNEAMAVGVPALVTQRCGCAGEIVIHEENGFVWEPSTIGIAAETLRRLIQDSDLRQAWSSASLQTISHWDLECFSNGLIAIMKLDEN